MKKNGKGSKGFTLIELIIVVVIIGILAAVAIPAYMTYIFKTRLMSKLDFSESQAMAMVENEIFGGAPGVRIDAVKQMIAAGFTKAEVAELASNGELAGVALDGSVFATMLATKKVETATYNAGRVIPVTTTPTANEVVQVNPTVVRGNYTYETLCNDGQEYLAVYRVVSNEEHVGGMFENLVPVGITQKFQKGWDSDGLEPVTCIGGTQ